jgi:endonuclease III
LTLPHRLAARPVSSGKLSDTAKIEQKLRAADQLLRKRYGTPRLGNKRNPISELIFIILSARTRGKHHEIFYRRLRRHFGSWDRVRDARVGEIERVIRNAGLSRIKARQIKGVLTKITKDFGSLSPATFRRMSEVQVEEYLASLPGVGLKTARCVMMYSLDHPVFPVDTHCIRLFHNLGLIRERPRFEDAQNPFQSKVPIEIRHSLHVNTVAHGREICIPRSERCIECVIAHLCINRRRHSANSHKPR